MTGIPLLQRIGTFTLLPAIAVGLALFPDLTPSAEAASQNASARIIKKLKKQIATLKKQLAATATRPPTPPPYIEMVPVGNPGNPADLIDGDADMEGIQNFGSVNYEFKIAKTEVTLTQYTDFLNAVARSDTYNLYSPQMETDTNIAGIVRNGISPTFTYSVIGNGNRPVTYVSWFDAARFCNWLHNGRPSGAQDATTTERGAYFLNGAVTGVEFERVWNAKYWIPTEDEWYKAAYYDPSEKEGDNDNYWIFPTRSNDFPTAELPPGTKNSANFGINAKLTPTGAYVSSESFYGTFDQGGNVWEWNDTAFPGSFRGRRGGSWEAGYGGELGSWIRITNTPATGHSPFIGFRVASP